MLPVKRTIKKKIVKTLSDAIDHEMKNDDSNAYSLYSESLSLVGSALLQETLGSNTTMTLKDKIALLEFARQSVTRLTHILKKKDGSNEWCDEERDEEEGGVAETESGESGGSGLPTEETLNAQLFGTRSPCKVLEDQLVDVESQLIVEKYQKRLTGTNSAVDRQNLQFEMARQIVERTALFRNSFFRAGLAASHKSQSLFLINEKLSSGTLKEIDLKKQQLFTLSYQYNECTPSIYLSVSEARASLQGQSLISKLVTLVLESSGHPMNMALSQMHKKIKTLSTSSYRDLNQFDNFASVVKEDLILLQETLKGLFIELDNEKNSLICFQLINHLYFSPVKQKIVNLIRNSTKEIEDKLKTTMHRWTENEGEGLRLRQHLQSKLVTINEDEKQEAITKLHYLTSLVEPYEMIDCSVYIIKLLVDNEFDKNHCTSVGADELLPRLCEVIINSKLPSIYSEVLFVEKFMPSDKALGEGGYAVTTLQSALAFIIDNV